MMPQAIGNDVIVHPIEPEEKIGLIHVPKTVRRRVNQGIITDIGPLVSEELETGDHVMFSGYSGDKLTFADGGTFYVVPEAYVIAKVTNSEVILMDSNTVKRIIQDRFGELYTKFGHRTPVFEEIEQSLLDRVDSITMVEGFEF
jgi:co-chaperonin GroES (HSP10)